ncbi:DUF3616 domain-containing protein [Aquincola sp. S2]|uniref:DUF3616 domain-containing protein n=1 Tax=Pseudaquabacterium terrae TaxID=2732868 RepID=A0ABX2EU38_9BURK|nr:DUF3616 domain-containing protein [Aquabacterium terrae]NRF72230.1 DUF3616 domain-containing protein [Aquabacterium terrae]
MGQTARALHAVAWVTWASLVPFAAHAQPPAVERYTGMAEASAAAMLDAQHFVVADDECNVLRVYRAGQAAPVGQPVDLRQFLGAGAKASDIEGAARVGDVVYWISSHSLTGNKGKFLEGRHRIFATKIEPGAGAAPTVRPTGEPFKRLLQELIAAPALQGLKLGKAAKKKPEQEDGLNIEGLAATPEGGLLIGFRNPLSQGKAILVPLANPADVIKGAKPAFADPVLLDLGGRGVRSIERAADQYLIVAGPVADAGGFALYQWSGKPLEAPRLRAELAPGFHAEAAFNFDGQQLMLLSDDGANSAEVECGAAPKTGQRFRAMRIKLN